jgi:hypothetical protein
MANPAVTSDADGRARVTLGLSEIATSSANNTSTVRITGTVSDNSTNFGGFGTGSWSATLNGVLRASGTVAYDFTGNSGNSYQFYVGDFSITHATNGSGSVTGSVSFSGATPVGSATADGSLTLTNFVRLPTTPNRPVLTRSNNGSTLTITGGSATFYGTGGYYQYGTSTNASTWSSSKTLGSGRVTSITVPNTSTYLARTRALDSEGTGAWSTTSIASTGVPSAPPTAPSLARSSDGTSITVTSSVPIDGATWGYAYRQSTDGVNWGDAVDIASGASVTITGLVYDQVYYYQTRGDNTIGFGAWSATRSSTGAAPLFNETIIASPAYLGVNYTDGVSALRARSYSIKAGSSFPSGLSLNSTTGAITGPPSVPGTFGFTILANNNAGTVEVALTLVVLSAVRVWVSRVAPATSGFVPGLINVWVGSPTNAFRSGTIKVWDGIAWKNTN